MSELMRVSHWSDLMKSVQPDLYRLNAYRILGCGVDATVKQIDQRSRLMKVGLPVDREGPLSGLYQPPSPEEVEAAARHLHDPVNRFFHWLFWLWPGEGANENGAGDDLLSLHNSAVINHAKALHASSLSLDSHPGNAGLGEEALWRESLACWQSATLRSDFADKLAERASELDDPRLNKSLIEGIVSVLPAALLTLNGRLAAAALDTGEDARAEMHVRLMRSAFSQSDQETAAEEAVTGIRNSLNQMVEDAGRDFAGTPGKLRDACRSLMSRADKPLRTLDVVLPKGHAAIELHRDKVARKVLELQIAYGRATEDWRTSLDLLKSAHAISRGEQAKSVLAENIEIVGKNLELATCWYCGKEAADDDSSVPVPMHRVVERIPTWDGTHIRWEKLDVKVPRCKRCRRILVTNRKRLALFGILHLVFGFPAWFALAFLIGRGIGAAAGLAEMGAVLANIGFLVAWLLWPRLVISHGTRYRNATEFPGVQELRQEGWEFGEKPQGT